MTSDERKTGHPPLVTGGDLGIASVKANAPVAPIEDTTEG